MKKQISISVMILIFALTVITWGNEKHTYKPPNGYVSTEETAIAIAVAVWTPIYGKDKIAKEMPYKAILSNGIWTVSGSLPNGKAMPGGVAVIEISKDDGTILRLSHGK